MPTVRTTTRMRVEVEIVGSSYGTDWSIGDMLDQARREIPEKLAALLAKSPGARIVGTPKILFTSAEEE